MSPVQTLLRLVRSLRRDQSGLALTEFALTAPLVMTMGLFGLEAANMARAHMRISQITSTVADTTSRVGEDNLLTQKRIRESDINDAFEGVRAQSGSYDITTHGRVILTSLEQNPVGGQWIRWQRCVGLKNVASSYGTVVADGATRTNVPGMGDPGDEIMAPPDSAVMFVEVVYDYQPLFSNSLFGAKTIRSKAAFLVRDRRDLTAGNNPRPETGVAASNCTQFTV